jgi:hypothetical protein
MVKTRFTQLLLFITLRLVDDYETPLIFELLEKNEDELLQPLWDLYPDRLTYLSKVVDFKAEGPLFTAAESAAECHRITLFRFLIEYAGGKVDKRQHRFDLNFIARGNANIFGSMLGISGSNPFGTFDSQKLLNALSRSPIFPGDTVHQWDLFELNTKLMAHLQFGFPDEHLVCYSME